MLRIRRLAPFFVLVLAALLLAGCMSAEARVSFDRLNVLRTERGVPALVEDPQLVDKAEQWAQRLASDGTLRHSDLLSGIDPSRWGFLGENVGVAGGSPDVVSMVQAVQDAFERSAPHLANAVDGRFTHAGVGVAVSADSRVFVVQSFGQAA
jgi:uncharacterized protein YkwD